MAARSFRNNAFIVPSEPDLHLVSDTIRHGVQGDAGEAQNLMHMCDVFLIAGDPVESLRTNDFEAAVADIRQKPAQSRASTNARAGDRLIEVAVRNFPPFPFRQLAA